MTSARSSVPGLTIDLILADARRGLVAEHLDDCLRCGLNASIYRWLKARLAGLAPRADERQLARLWVFADDLLAGPS